MTVVPKKLNGFFSKNKRRSTTRSSNNQPIKSIMSSFSSNNNASAANASNASNGTTFEPNAVSFEPNAVPTSVFLPHVDTNQFSFEDIAYQFEQVFQIGVLDRIEAIPKVNQKDGHSYVACYLYFTAWGNNYYAQFLRMQLMYGNQTPMYVLPNLFWMVCPNTSVVHVENIPHAQHMALLVSSNTSHCLSDIIESFELQDIGKVSVTKSYYVQDVPPCASMAVNDAYMALTDSDCDSGDSDSHRGMAQVLENPREIAVVHLEYWFHSKTAHEFQKCLESKFQCIGLHGYGGSSGEGDNESCWVITQYPVTDTPGINPYIWYAPSPAARYMDINDTHAYVNLLHEKYIRKEEGPEHNDMTMIASMV